MQNFGEEPAVKHPFARQKRKLKINMRNGLTVSVEGCYEHDNEP
jgi:hypothetical protein